MASTRGRWTLGLYNSYDPHHFHEAMRRAVARAAPLCRAFDLDLASIGFPFHAFRDKKGRPPERETPPILARILADSTTIGEGGEYLVALAEEGRFHTLEFPPNGFPMQFGTVVLATETPDPQKRIDMRDLAFRTRVGESFLFIVGLGPRGVPKDIERVASHHLELTGRDLSMETATAMGVLVGRLWECYDHVTRPLNPPLASDAIVIRDGEVLLVRRANEPHRGLWALPGGFVNPGEQTEAAALRELREETGLEGAIQGLVGVYSAPGRDPRGPTVSIAYRATASGTPRAADDASDARYFPLDELPPLAFDHAHILLDARRKPQP